VGGGEGLRRVLCGLLIGKSERELLYRPAEITTRPNFSSTHSESFLPLLLIHTAMELVMTSWSGDPAIPETTNR
jgi:hypothetical protein